jgi:signal transduction histidine kinase
MKRRLRGVSPFAWDVLIALALGIGGVVEVLSLERLEGPMWANLAGVVLVSGTVATRRVRPLASSIVWLATVCGMVAAGASPDSFSSPFLSLLLLPYAAASRAELRPALASLAIMWAGVAGVWWTDEPRIFGDLFFPGMFATVFWVAGRVVRSRSQLTAELHEAAVRAADAREAEALRAVAEERRRIAREMHDVVAHSVSMMVVQAGGARRILDRDTERAVAAAELIERTGREALAEMRRLLGVLHPDEHAEYAPQPTLRQLDALVERARGAGVPVTLNVEGEQRELPAGLDLAAYRVVQEALTNVVKHSGGAPTEVSVHYRADAVDVRIADRGSGSLNNRLEGGGHGLVGMRERVRMYGGELHAGRRRGGGFEVHVRLPLEGEEDAALTAGARA